MPLPSWIYGGSNTAGVANVDANYNLQVVTPQDHDQAGYVMLSGRLSKAADPAGLITEDIRVSAQGRLTVGQPVMLMNIIPNQTAINSANFTVPVTTMTVTAASGTINLNPAASVATSAVARISSYTYFPFQADFATYCTMDVLLMQPPQTNNTVEFGFIICTGTAAPTDGAFFRYDATGVLKAVTNNNGTELMSAAITAPSNAEMHKYKIVVENDRVMFYIDGACVAEIASPTNLGMPMYSGSQPWTVRTYNGGVSPSLAQIVKIGYAFVGLQDAAGLGLDAFTLAALRGAVASQGQDGQTMGTKALYSNNLAAGAGVAMTNTTAALGTGLGGQFSALPTLAAGSDGIVCSYLNPVATAAIPGKTILIKGVRIQGAVTTILAGGPVLYAYSLAYGSTALTLVPTESATAKGARRVALGFETFAATAAVGTLGSPGGVYMPFAVPIPVNPGEYIQIAAKNLGTVTTTGVITFLVTFDAAEI